MTKLKKALKEYLSVRRAIGYKLLYDGSLLKEFVEFAEKEKAPYITLKLALKWATISKDTPPTAWARRLYAVRGFAKYQSATDPRTQIPPKELLPYRYHRNPPYIYTDTEISKLIGAAKKLRSPRGLRAATMSMIIGLLAVTGMRISETINLDNEDVDLEHGILTISGTKFNKSRLVPVHISTRDELRRYAHLRDKICPKPKSTSFFISGRGTRFTAYMARYWFVALSQQIGLRNPGDNHGPRLHDFRHRFTIKTMLGWYRSGINVEQNIMTLVTYLGHSTVNNTYWYISAVPELLRLAAQRLEKKGELTQCLLNIHSPHCWSHSS
ncbi:MAG: tyrosine-type recombinase/integrase [Lentisphaerae bacterium]|nr:tyrosine-type recombinase/integrase [Lentisphaerota bacterium]